MRTEVERLKESYRDGVEDGRGVAERDVSNGAPVGSLSGDYREGAHAAVARVRSELTRRNAAYDLGFARGYREVARG